jgi:hypothetical protein
MRRGEKGFWVSELFENMTRHRIRVPRRALRRVTLLLSAPRVTFLREVLA